MAFLIAPRKSTRWSSLSWRAGKGLYSYLTAMENLQYFLGLNGIALSHIKAEVDILCDQLAFTPYKDTLVSELSQGNRQKLTLILALVQKPESTLFG